MYFNEIEPYAADWIANLYPGVTIDRRSIADVQPDELRGEQRAHFFAGIGGWEHALSLAGWPSDREVWTGSCPCQPFSGAGKQRGTADARHLWPEFRRLIAEQRPATVFGEQVASKLGREWLSGVRADLEALGYAVGCADLCAASAGAPHIRQRLWWVADANQQRCGEARSAEGGCGLGGSGAYGGLADTLCSGRPERWSESGRGSLAGSSSNGGLGHADDTGLSERGGDGRLQREALGTYKGQTAIGPSFPGWNGPNEWLACTDGKARRTQSGLFPLAHGVSGRVGRLRAYGNAIVPQVAASFIRAFLAAEQVAA